MKRLEASGVGGARFGAATLGLVGLWTLQFHAASAPGLPASLRALWFHVADLEARAALAIRLAALGHFVILVASAQVPSRLRWREELARLSPLNRKLMWVYGGFTVLTIVAFGVMTGLLHEELLRGDRAARVLAGFIGVYWSARIGVELLAFEESDWPQGRGVRAGRWMLLGLFTLLAGVYGCVAFGK